KSGGREAINHRLAQATAELDASEHNRPKIAGHRPSEVVQALIQRAQQDNRFQKSQQCIRAWTEIRKFCQEYGDLKIELANAQQDDRVVARIEALRKEIDDLKQRGGGQPRDAQAEMIKTLTGFQEDTAENILSVAVALLVEL